MPDGEMKVSPSNLDDAAKGKTDTIILSHGTKGGRGVKNGDDLAGALKQAGVPKDWKGRLVIAFPDVCKTPPPGGPIPIPYPNIAQAGGGGGSKVKIKDKLAQHGFKDIEVHTQGDAAGAIKGLGAKSFAPGDFSLYSFDVKMQGKGGLRFGDMTQHNGLMGHEAAHVVQQGATPHHVPKSK